MADKKIITLINGKYGVNGKRVSKFRYKSTTDGNWYQINSDGTRTFLRYADGPQNYDRFPTGSYLRTIENADSAGYINGKWYTKDYYNQWAKQNNVRNQQGHQKKVFDENQIGIGIDMRPDSNPYVQQFLKKDNNGTYLTEADEHKVRQHTIQEKDNTLNRLLKKNKLNIELSPNKRAMALGLIYQGYGKILFNPNGTDSNKLHNAFINGTDKQFSNAIYNFYKTRHSDRAERHRTFWDGKLKLGGTIRKKRFCS